MHSPDEAVWPSRDIPWGSLTSSPLKAALYTDDSALREAWAQLDTMLGECIDTSLHRIATLVVKSEGLVGRRLSPAIHYLAENGFEPIAYRSLSVNSQMARTLWQYQWNAAAIDRVRLHVSMLERCPSLLVVFKDRSEPYDVPASVRLWGKKGPSDEDKRNPSHLRSVLNMTNRMIGFVHTADEPVDIVREQGIFFDRRARDAFWCSLLENFGGDVTEQLLEAGEMMERNLPNHSLGLQEAVASLCSDKQQLTEDLLQQRKQGVRFRLDYILSAFGDIATEYDWWSFAVIAASLIEYDIPEKSPILSALAYPDAHKVWSSNL